MTPLRQRMLHDMQIRNLAENTQKSYLMSAAASISRKTDGLKLTMAR